MITLTVDTKKNEPSNSCGSLFILQKINTFTLAIISKYVIICYFCCLSWFEEATLSASINIICTCMDITFQAMHE